MSLAEPTNQRDVIDEHLFIEALALTAFEVNYRDPQPSVQEKVKILNLTLLDNITYGKTQSFLGTC